MSKKKQVLIVDGDCLAFRVSAACEQRSVLAKHIKSGREKEFKTRTELKELCKSKNIEFKPEDYEFTDIQTAEPEAYARSTVKKSLKKIHEHFPDAELVFAVQGEGNFRDDLPLPVKYKGSRVDTIRPVHLKNCKDQLVNLGGRLSRDEEVDDFVIWKGYEYLSKGYDVIIATPDKDAMGAYDGLKVWNFTDPSSSVISIEGLGELWEKKSNIKGKGFLWWCMQASYGDPGDFYQPQDLTIFSLGKKVKFGDKGAYKLLKDCKTEQEAWDKVRDKYKEWFPEPFAYTDWKGEVHENVTYKDVLKLYHKCVYMKTSPTDKIDLMEFLHKRGIKFE